MLNRGLPPLSANGMLATSDAITGDTRSTEVETLLTTVQSTGAAAPAWTVPRQSGALTAFKLAGVVVSGTLLVALLVRIALSLAAGTSPWLVIPAFALGYLGADLMSGTAHWFCDTFFEEGTPVIGRVLIQPFRDHHVHPLRITRYRFIEQDTTNFVLMLAPLAVAFWLGLRAPAASVRSSGARVCSACRRDHSARISFTSGHTRGSRRSQCAGSSGAASSLDPSGTGAITATIAADSV